MLIKSFDGVSLYVETSNNENEPLLFIHGGPGAWSYSFKYFADDYIKRFANGIYLDQRGSGRSEGDKSRDYSLDSMMKDIEAVRTALNYEKMSIIAHSFGGVIAVNYAFKYPNHINKLILSNCTLNLVDSLQEQMNFGSRLLNESPSTEPSMDAFQHMIHKLIDQNVWYKIQYKDKENLLLMNQIDEGIKNHTFSRIALHMPEYFKSFYDVTEQIKKPTLIISGRDDYSVGPNHYKQFKFPNACIKVMDSKHVPFIEDQEDYFRIIEAFLK